ncbi:MAG TPA: NAD(P)-dependent oxidoreductase [Blastocatellia bacterium]|nr:NAD(P)-dependent oxidoreductase [Blastocatellia bacterium]
MDLERQARFKIARVPVPKQDPQLRIYNWNEVFLGYSPDTAMVEAARCLQCEHHPCTDACPVGNDIPGALWLLEQGDVIGAANKFRETSNEPEICGRICPQEKLCEGACVVGYRYPPVNIGKLEAFCTDYQRRIEGYPQRERKPRTGLRVALVGAGPASLVVAEEMTVNGHECVVYEAWPRPGGLLLYGIPNFKLDKQVVYDYLDHLEEIGVTFVCNTRIGVGFSVDDLLDKHGYDAVFIGHGAPINGDLEIEGESLKNVYQATEYLVRGNLAVDDLPEHLRERPHVGRHTVIVGGGDTSMDCVRTAKRLAPESEVSLVYRRTEAEMQGRAEERAHAREEGVVFNYLTTPTRFISDDSGRVVGMELVRMELGPPDSSGRRTPVPKPDSQFSIECDTVVLAVGYWPDPEIGETTTGLDTHRYGLIKVATEETGHTSRPGVFAAGDNVRGADLVVTAVAAARNAARAMDRYLQDKLSMGATIVAQTPAAKAAVLPLRLAAD